MSFKPSPRGGRRLAGKQIIHQPITTWSIEEASSVNVVLLQVEGKNATKFLIDSGAAVSVVQYDHLSPGSHANIDSDVLPAVGADVNSLDVLEQIALPVSGESFAQITNLW